MKRLTLNELLKRDEGFTPSLKQIQREVNAAANDMKQLITKK